MFPIAHIVIASLASNISPGRGRLWISILGGLLPDLVDKPPAWILHRTESSHGLAHSIAGIMVTRAFARRLLGNDEAQQLTIAYVSHLVADEMHHGRVPWGFPVSRRKRRPKGVGKRNLFVGLVGEALALAYVARAMTKPATTSKPASTSLL